MYEGTFLKGVCKVYLGQEKWSNFIASVQNSLVNCWIQSPLLRKMHPMKAHSKYPAKKDLNNAELNIHTAL